MTMTGYRGAVGGSIQTNYTDQPGRGVPGMMAYVSEEGIANIMSVVVDSANGVYAGRGVIKTWITPGTGDLNTPALSVGPPASGSAIADFAGTVLFDEGMQSDTAGLNGWADGKYARILRPKRQGGTVMVKVFDTIAVTDTVYMCTVADTAGVYAPGDFTNQNTASGGTFISLATIATWRMAAVGTSAAPAISMIEFGVV